MELIRVREVADVYTQPLRERIPLSRIEAYKKAELEKQAPPSIAWRIANAIGGSQTINMALLSAVFGTFFILVCSLLSALVATGFLTMDAETFLGMAPLRAVYFSLASAVVLLFLLRGLISLQAIRIVLRGPCYWKEIPYYGGDVPSFAQQLVREARLRNPYATFSVDVLERDNIVIDPILYIIEVGPSGETIKEGLCVWDADGKEVVI